MVFSGEESQIQPFRLNNATTLVEELAACRGVQKWAMYEDKLTSKASTITFDHTTEIESRKIARLTSLGRTGVRPGFAVSAHRGGIMRADSVANQLYSFNAPLGGDNTGTRGLITVHVPSV